MEDVVAFVVEQHLWWQRDCERSVSLGRGVLLFIGLSLELLEQREMGNLIETPAHADRHYFAFVGVHDKLTRTRGVGRYDEWENTPSGGQSVQTFTANRQSTLWKK